MDVTFVVINIAVLLALIGLLVYMQKKHVSFTKRVFAGLGIGIVFGVILQVIYGEGSNVLSETTEWFNIVGRGYIRLLMMIVIPLVMVSIIQSIINLEKTSELGKMSAWIIGILIATTMVAALIGIGSAAIFNLDAEQIDMGQAEADRGLMMEDRLGDVEGSSTPAKILDFIPANIFLDMTGERSTSVIAVVIFSMIVGVAVLGLRRKQPEQAEAFTKIVNAFYAVVMRIVTLVLRLTPFGILALMATTVANTNFAGIVELGKFVIASYVALFVMFIIHLVLISLFVSSLLCEHNLLSSLTVYEHNSLDIFVFSFFAFLRAGLNFSPSRLLLNPVLYTKVIMAGSLFPSSSTPPTITLSTTLSNTYRSNVSITSFCSNTFLKANKRFLISFSSSKIGRAFSLFCTFSLFI